MTMETIGKAWIGLLALLAVAIAMSAPATAQQ
jgi:hypothetical protein